MEDFNLIMYRDTRGEGNGNFGDELSPTILKYLLDKHSIELNFCLNKNKNKNLVFIGSLIGWANNNYNNVYILGGGIRTDRDRIKRKTKMSIYSVRGPLTE